MERKREGEKVRVVEREREMWHVIYFIWHDAEVRLVKKLAKSMLKSVHPIADIVDVVWKIKMIKVIWEVVEISRKTFQVNYQLVAI